MFIFHKVNRHQSSNIYQTNLRRIKKYEFKKDIKVFFMFTVGKMEKEMNLYLYLRATD